MAKAKLQKLPRSARSPKVIVPPVETQEIVYAIRNRMVDALGVAGDKDDQVVLLQGAELPYRVLIEPVSDGAATLDANGTVLYANNRFAQILNISPEKFIGSPLQGYFPQPGRAK